MNYLAFYNQIKYCYEDRFDQKNEFFYQKIINQIYAHGSEWATIQQFPDINYEGIFNSLHFYALEYRQDIDFIYDLMKKYHYSFFHTILWCISDICNVNYEKTEQFLIDIYCNSPYIYKIVKENHTYIVDSIFGLTKFQRATDYIARFHNPTLHHLVVTKDFMDYCHDSTLLITKNLKNSIACTTLCKQGFIGTHYHSFTLHDCNCIDLNYNCVIPVDEYQALTNALWIQRLPHSALEKVTEPFLKYGSALLYSALHTQAQNLQMKKKVMKSP